MVSEGVGVEPRGSPLISSLTITEGHSLSQEGGARTFRCVCGISVTRSDCRAGLIGAIGTCGAIGIGIRCVRCKREK